MFFSVIIPVYNVEKYLNECVDSILSQTFEDFEVILVDDGSKDGSGKICDEYAAKDARVKVIHKENGGQSTARNRGVAEAVGEYAVFIDSDDFFSKKTFFADLRDNINEKTDIVIFRYHKYYSADRRDDCGISLADIDASDKTELIRQLVMRDAFFCSCWSKCTRMSLLKDNGIVFDENLRCEDMDWYYSVIMKAENFAVIDKSYVNYRQRENSVTSAPSVKAMGDFIYTIDKWYGIFNKIEGGESGALLSSLAKLYCNLIISFVRGGKAAKHLKAQIFAFKPLLKYDMNPRTRLIGRFSKLFGLNLTCLALKILDKVK